MRNLPKLLFQRVVVVSLAILLQILFVIAGMDWLREYWHWMKTAMDVIKWVAVLTIMTGRSNPSYKMAWIILILAFPVAGITIYLLFGGNRISNRENRRMNRVEVMVAQHLRQEKSVMQALEPGGHSGVEPRAAYLPFRARATRSMITLRPSISRAARAATRGCSKSSKRPSTIFSSIFYHQ